METITSSDSLHFIVTDHVISFPEDIVIDILSRLPVKSLMQFKSVCKGWLSLIKQDRHLIDLHFIRSKSRPNLLYSNPLPEKGGRIKNKRLEINTDPCAEIVEGSGDEEQMAAIISKVRITDDKWFLYDQILEPVNGLVCFVDWKTYAIRVYNASTREATPWLRSTLLAEENHKLIANKSRLKIKSLVARRQHHRYNSMERPDYENWEALTVGCDTKWRRINAVPNENNQINIKQVLPPANSSRQQVCADGTLYWSNKEYYWDVFRDSNPDDPNVIVAFDVGSRVIPIPNFILDEPRDEKHRLPIDMLAFGRHVALLYQMEPYVVKLWMLDVAAGKKLENCRGNTSNWSAETITLPFSCGDWIGGYGIAGSTEKILFERLGSKYKCNIHI
ncbi:hypothetical protein MKX01_022946 [Papaver californicum]|nr:hypothetical protein MKX01_022946 [Papaver californicum]